MKKWAVIEIKTVSEDKFTCLYDTEDEAVENAACDAVANPTREYYVARVVSVTRAAAKTERVDATEPSLYFAPGTR